MAILDDARGTAAFRQDLEVEQNKAERHSALRQSALRRGLFLSASRQIEVRG